ncbi:hypothetical protein Pcinc_017812 [Petrolisthes cinctipes]|uniref:PHD-type domain-containing protein n=1 Tax=Petrolisthes cinctipes TaxID=88211 RepID=A0AAE1FPY7_PETCI|nr:hypothetical protein Pcinc_017812 [Petrolisthes cinctipes]
MDKRGARKKEYKKECSRYRGKVNEDQKTCKKRVELKRCKRCWGKVQEIYDGMQCDKCGFWYHILCDDIEEDLYNELQKDDRKVLWFCRSCNAMLKKNPTNFLDNTKLKQDIVRMKEELKEVKEGHQQACEALRKFEGNLEKKESITLQGNDDDDVGDKVENNIVKDLNMIKLEMEGMQKKIKNLSKKWEGEKEMDEYIPVTKKVFEIPVHPVIKEKEERDRRKNNLVIHNIEEPNNMNEKELYDHDLAICMDIFGNEIGEPIEEGDIVSITRLGKKEEEGENQNPRPRCLLIKMKEPEKKWSILKNAKKMKTTRKNEYKRVFIQPDLTKSERAKDKESREKLREKREQGEEGWYIKRGQLERRN